MLKELVKERLMAAADEIFGLFERTIASYEEELCRTKEENERQRQQMEAVSKTHIVLHIEDVQQLSGRQEERRSFTLKEEEDPQPPHVKEEEQELGITQEGEFLLGPDEADLAKVPPTGVSVKTEDSEVKPPEGSQLHQRPSPSSSSPQHNTEADGEHRGGSRVDRDDATSHSAEDKYRGDTQEPLCSDTHREVWSKTGAAKQPQTRSVFMTLPAMTHPRGHKRPHNNIQRTAGFTCLS
ncbi:uncharacterized protein LOC129179387 isoform X3 [Dunckerocampus dactyliophorus]|uniref:uncharacterized protein LOC129179387 isoform X3 n=1 Tax=Dunckerocampus dactyliophorus TaxID=161453 RepID=UPI00240514F8|nr:uncharacterized protein LOC129179387 isoform X3 [Dunckerocampus dactyliophorus]